MEMPWGSLLAAILVGLNAMIWVPLMSLLWNGKSLNFFGHSDSSKSALGIQNVTAIDWDVLSHQGGNAPWRPKTDGVLESGLDVPEGCLIDQIHMMSRHAERYPTMASGAAMIHLYYKLRRSNLTFVGDLAFVNEWDFFAPFPAQQFENLTTTATYAGSLQAFATGVKLRTRHPLLLEQALSAGKVTFWSGISTRVMHTAQLFASGFFGVDWQESATLHIMPKGLEYGGRTLSPSKGCPNYVNHANGHRYGLDMFHAFRSTYLPAISQRLQIQNPDIIFSDSEIYSMQEMCGFETLAKGQSDWCKVFTREEWESFEYARDLLHFYRAGPGNPYGPTMGWLWLNATANLLREGPNAGPLFLSFNHDGDIVALLAALDLLPQTPELPTTHVLHNRTWRTSDMVPMGGRIILERFVCAATPYCWNNGPMYPNHVYCEPAKNDTFVRVNVNDGIVPIPGCDHGRGRACPLADFSERLKERGEKAGDFAGKCGLPEGVPDRIDFLHQSSKVNQTTAVNEPVESDSVESQPLDVSS